MKSLMNYKLFEDIHPSLRKAAEAFDQFCVDHQIEYTVESDEVNEQIYRVDSHEIGNIRSEMDNIAVDNKIFLRTEIDKFGTIFIFSIKPLQESDVAEDQYKFATKKHIRDQSAFRSAIGLSKSFGGIEKYQESDLKKKLDEGFIGLSQPEVLLVINPEYGASNGGPNRDSLIQKANEMLDELSGDLDPDMENVRNIIEDLIEKLSRRIYKDDAQDINNIDNIIDSQIP